MSSRLKVLAVIVGVVLALPIGDWLITQAENMGWATKGFGANFWPNFWAEVIVGVVIIYGVGGRVAQLTRQKPKARILLETDGNPVAGHRVWFRIQNTGNFSFRSDEVRWELFIRKGTLEGLDSWEHQSDPPGGSDVEMGNVTYKHYYALLRKPLFPGVSIRFLYSDLTAILDLSEKMYFVISTPQGQIPENLERTRYGLVNVATAAEVEPYSIHGVANVTLDSLDTITATGEVRDSGPSQ